MTERSVNMAARRGLRRAASANWPAQVAPLHSAAMRSLLLVVLLASGCAGLRPDLVEASVQKPSNVALYFTVDTAHGDPGH